MLEPEPTKRFRFIYSAEPDPRTSGSKSGSNRVWKVCELDHGQSSGNSAVEKHGQWTIQEERELIYFLSDRRVEAGDGANFKQAVWTQAATHMSTLHPNIAFNATQCSSKWGRVHCLYNSSKKNFPSFTGSREFQALVIDGWMQKK